jgi:hypothetical protein
MGYCCGIDTKELPPYPLRCVAVAVAGAASSQQPAASALPPGTPPARREHGVISARHECGTLNITQTRLGHQRSGIHVTISTFAIFKRDYPAPGIVDHACKCHNGVGKMRTYRLQLFPYV